MRQIGLLSLVLSGTIFSGTAAMAADPALLNLVMPDAKVLAGVNLTSARISPLGQFIISKISLNGNGLQKLIANTGFNPLQDVTEILAASAADPANPGGLVLASGTFPVDKFTAALAGKANATVQTTGNVTLITYTNPKEKVPHAVAFIGTTIAVAGDLPSVNAAIARVSSPAAIDPALAVQVNQLSGSEDEWLVSSTSLASLLPANLGANAKGPALQVLPLLKSIQSFDGGVKFGQTVAFTGEAVASSPQNAAALQAVVKLGLALVSSYQGTGSPELQELLQLVQTMQVTVSGQAVDLALSIPEAQLETLLNSAQASVKPVANRRNGLSPQNGEIRNGR
jgi:hypothetical protein